MRVAVAISTQQEKDGDRRGQKRGRVGQRHRIGHETLKVLEYESKYIVLIKYL